MPSPSPGPAHPGAKDFRIRAVVIDHYLATPLRDLDPTYSELTGHVAPAHLAPDVTSVPIVRVFGTTPAGQPARNPCTHAPSASLCCAPRPAHAPTPFSMGLARASTAKQVQASALDPATIWAVPSAQHGLTPKNALSCTPCTECSPGISKTAAAQQPCPGWAVTEAGQAIPGVDEQWCQLNCYLPGTLILAPACDPASGGSQFCICGPAPSSPPESGCPAWQITASGSLIPGIDAAWCGLNCYLPGSFTLAPGTVHAWPGPLAVCPTGKLFTCGLGLPTPLQCHPPTHRDTDPPACDPASGDSQYCACSTEPSQPPPTAAPCPIWQITASGQGVPGVDEQWCQLNCYLPGTLILAPGAARGHLTKCICVLAVGLLCSISSPTACDPASGSSQYCNCSPSPPEEPPPSFPQLDNCLVGGAAPAIEWSLQGTILIVKADFDTAVEQWIALGISPPGGAFMGDIDLVMAYRISPGADCKRKLHASGTGMPSAPADAPISSVMYDNSLQKLQFHVDITGLPLADPACGPYQLVWAQGDVPPASVCGEGEPVSYHGQTRGRVSIDTFCCLPAACSPTCDDLCPNGDEAATDCGGSCAPCAQPEQDAFHPAVAIPSVTGGDVVPSLLMAPLLLTELRPQLEPPSVLISPAVSGGAPGVNLAPLVGKRISRFFDSPFVAGVPSTETIGGQPIGGQPAAGGPLSSQSGPSLVPFIPSIPSARPVQQPYLDTLLPYSTADGPLTAPSLLTAPQLAPDGTADPMVCECTRYVSGASPADTVLCMAPPFAGQRDCSPLEGRKHGPCCGVCKDYSIFHGPGEGEYCQNEAGLCYGTTGGEVGCFFCDECGVLECTAGQDLTRCEAQPATSEPTRLVTPMPSPRTSRIPTTMPTPQPTRAATPMPTTQPTRMPTSMPSPHVSLRTTPVPSPQSTRMMTPMPSPQPTRMATSVPSPQSTSMATPVANPEESPLATTVNAVCLCAGEEAGDVGLVGGHFDVDSTNSIGGNTQAWPPPQEHKHEYDDDFGECVDLFTNNGGIHSVFTNIPTGQPFKLQLANANLNAGARISINAAYDPAHLPSSFDKTTCTHGDPGSSWVYSTDFDDTALLSLSSPTFSLGSLAAGADCELTSLSICYTAAAFRCFGIMPTQTGCVKVNKAGPNGEWRNGALVLQALPVDVGGALLAGCNLDFLASSGLHGVAAAMDPAGCMYQEWTVFWHWDFTALTGSTCDFPDIPCSKDTCYGDQDWEGCMELIFGPIVPEESTRGCQSQYCADPTPSALPPSKMWTPQLTPIRTPVPTVLAVQSPIPTPILTIHSTPLPTPKASPDPTYVPAVAPQYALLPNVAIPSVTGGDVVPSLLMAPLLLTELRPQLEPPSVLISPAVSGGAPGVNLAPLVGKRISRFFDSPFVAGVPSTETIGGQPAAGGPLSSQSGPSLVPFIPSIPSARPVQQPYLDTLLPYSTADGPLTAPSLLTAPQLAPDGTADPMVCECTRYVSGASPADTVLCMAPPFAGQRDCSPLEGRKHGPCCGVCKDYSVFHGPGEGEYCQNEAGLCYGTTGGGGRVLLLRRVRRSGVHGGAGLDPLPAVTTPHIGVTPVLGPPPHPPLPVIHAPTIGPMPSLTQPSVAPPQTTDLIPSLIQPSAASPAVASPNIVLPAVLGAPTAVLPTAVGAPTVVAQPPTTDLIPSLIQPSA
eukprot:gene7079-171_t